MATENPVHIFPSAPGAVLLGYVTVRVGRGDAAIEELYLAGRPLREYLRENRTSR